VTKNDTRQENRVTKQQKKIQDAFKEKREVEVIPAKVSYSHVQKKRVAAYCRVSTYADAQSGSFELKIQSYKEKILSNPDWEFSGIYADRGASGTTIKKREHFNHMLMDDSSQSLVLQNCLPWSDRMQRSDRIQLICKYKGQPLLYQVQLNDCLFVIYPFTSRLLPLAF